MMPIALVVLGRASGESSLVTSIIGLIVVGIGDCKVPSAYPWPNKQQRGFFAKSRDE